MHRARVLPHVGRRVRRPFRQNRQRGVRDRRVVERGDALGPSEPLQVVHEPARRIVELLLARQPGCAMITGVVALLLPAAWRSCHRAAGLASHIATSQDLRRRQSVAGSSANTPTGIGWPRRRPCSHVASRQPFAGGAGPSRHGGAAPRAREPRSIERFVSGSVPPG